MYSSISESSFCEIPQSRLIVIFCILFRRKLLANQNTSKTISEIHLLLTCTTRPYVRTYRTGIHSQFVYTRHPCTIYITIYTHMHLFIYSWGYSSGSSTLEIGEFESLEASPFSGEKKLRDLACQPASSKPRWLNTSTY